MGRTTNRGYWYPPRTALPRYGWRDIQLLAEDIDDDIATIVQRLTPSSASIATSQTTASATYTNLTTVGPAVTLTTGVRALVIITARMRNSGVNLTRMSVDITGATAISASDDRSLEHEGTGWQRASTVFLQEALTPGSHTFKAEYKVAAGTGTFEDRNIVVIPLL